MAFTLRQVEIFVEAATDQNFRKTADRLGISQPAISKHIQLLEKRAGGRLFLRDRGATARLSPLGEDMLVEARAMLRAARKVESRTSAGDNEEISLRIAAGPYLLDRWIRPQAGRFVTTAPGLNLEFLQAGDHEELIRMLRAGEADYVFYTGQGVDGDDIECRVLGSFTIGLYAAPLLARGVQRLPDDLNALPFLLSNKGSRSEAWQRATLEQAGITPRIVASRAQFMEVMIELVRAGQGAALLFDGDVTRFVASGEIVRFALDFPPGFRLMLCRAGARRDPREDRIINAICAVLQDAA